MGNSGSKRQRQGFEMQKRAIELCTVSGIVAYL